MKPDSNLPRRIGPLPRILKRNPLAGVDGVPVYELQRWRCADCGLSLFREDGTCSVCSCKVRIPRQKGE